MVPACGPIARQSPCSRKKCVHPTGKSHQTSLYKSRRLFKHWTLWAKTWVPIHSIKYSYLLYKFDIYSISSYSYAQESLSQAFIASKGPSVAWEVRKVSRTWGAEWITGSPKRPPSCCSDVRAAHPAVRAARIKNKTYRLLKSMVNI